MTDEFRNNVNSFAQHSAAWIGIGGAIFAVLSFCMLLGMWYGPLQKLPVQYDAILTKLGILEGRQNKSDWDIGDINARLNALGARITATEAEQQKLWDLIRALETEITKLKMVGLSRETMIEWMAALGARNKSLSMPPLSKDHQ